MTTAFDHKSFLAKTPTLPGVYRMYDNAETLLYVGKAKDLRKRLSSYFRSSGLSIKNQSLMSQVTQIETVVTNSETEALILENNLIKEYHPKYNILLRDDKTYPYIFLTRDDPQQFKLYRGSREPKGKYFGPYPSVGAAKEALDVIQKVFKVGNCKSGFGKIGDRPCFNYQIDRCSGICCGEISKREYAEQIKHAMDFLSGKSEAVTQTLTEKMLIASNAQDYEAAANYRDQIQNLRKAQEKQYVSNETGNADVIALRRDAFVTVVTVFYYRNGQNVGSQSHFPKVRKDHDDAEILQAFIEQLYADKTPPDEFIVRVLPEESDMLITFFTQKAEKKTRFNANSSGNRAKWLQLAEKNADVTLASRREAKLNMQAKLSALQSTLNLAEPPARFACVDVSHTMGEETVASYVVFDQDGAKKSEYRKYNIKDEIAGDDYGAMRQALTRRFKRFTEQSDDNATKTNEAAPDILFVDGGKGQFNVAREVLDDFAVDCLLVGIAKGEGRKAGLETLFVGATSNAVNLAENNPALHLIQQIRDEAHRFAITAHRKKRDKKRVGSVLDDIDGVGPKRRMALLKRYGGLKGVMDASIEDLAKTDGINKSLAEIIYNHLHGKPL